MEEMGFCWAAVQALGITLERLMALCKKYSWHRRESRTPAAVEKWPALSLLVCWGTFAEAIKPSVLLWLRSSKSAQKCAGCHLVRLNLVSIQHGFSNPPLQQS